MRGGEHHGAPGIARSHTEITKGQRCLVQLSRRDQGPIFRRIERRNRIILTDYILQL